MTERCWDCNGTPEECECAHEFMTCECRQIDVDQLDADSCPVHGPDGIDAHEQRLLDAADEAAYWRDWEELHEPDV